MPCRDAACRVSRGEGNGASPVSTGKRRRRTVAETRKFPHHLIREIFEQPDALRRTIAPRVSQAAGRVRLDQIHISREELRALRRINIVASGTSRHAGMTGQYMLQELVGVPVDVDYASEFEYRNPMIGRGELSIFITQSGETADTTASQREARQKGSRTIAISNVEGSTIAREADGFIYTHAGPEISIASTKAFTAQMACLFLFALFLGEIKERVSKALARRYIGELLALPQKTETILSASDRVAARRASKNAFLVQFDATMMPDPTSLSWSRFERGIRYDRKTAK